MSSIAEDAADAIRRAIDAIDAERENLSRALESLGGPVEAANPRKRAAAPPTRPRRAAKRGRRGKRAKKGSRRSEVLALINKKPGLTGAAIAKEIGVAPSQIYNLCSALVKDGTIRKEGVTFSMMPGAPAPKETAKA
jgi:Winged helix-turn-helix DNA-binding